jgi:phosphoglycolate phosphatase
VPEVRALLFDKDGTLLDFQATWGKATLAVLGALADGDRAALSRLVALAEVDPATARFAPTSPVVAGSTWDYAPAWAAALNRDGGPAFLAEVDRLYLAFGRVHLTPIAGAAEALRRAAARGLPLGLATNDAEGNARANLAALAIAELLPFVAGYDSGHGAKPGPGMVLAFADWAGVDPAEVALVGDSAHDLLAARAAGALAVAVTTGLARREELEPLADLIAGSLDEALDTLGV